MTAARRLDDELVSRRGARARLEPHEGGERLSIYDAGGQLLFQYCPESGRGMLAVARGDLRLCAPHGAIELQATHGIRCRAGGDIVWSSATAARVDVGASRVALDQEGVTVDGDTVAVHAKCSELSLGQARAWANKLHATVDRAEMTFGHVLRRAERVIDQAGNWYQRIEELCELKAGRWRALVSGGVSLKGKDVSLKAQDGFAIDGERINLG
jgi:hypothetical protein